VCICVRARSRYYIRPLHAYICVCEQDSVCQCVYICIVLNDVSQHGLYIIFAEPPHCRFTDILYINIIKRHLIRPHSSQSVRTVCVTKTDQNESKVLEKITSSYKTYIPWCIYYYHYYYQHGPYQHHIVRDVILSFISTVNHWQLKVWEKLFTVHRT
jgi:hypothetical protein